jgi:hypothetical protein
MDRSLDSLLPFWQQSLSARLASTWPACSADVTLLLTSKRLWVPLQGLPKVLRNIGALTHGTFLLFLLSQHSLNDFEEMLTVVTDVREQWHWLLPFSTNFAFYIMELWRPVLSVDIPELHKLSTPIEVLKRFFQRSTARAGAELPSTHLISYELF